MSESQLTNTIASLLHKTIIYKIYQKNILFCGGMEMDGKHQKGERIEGCINCSLKEGRKSAQWDHTTAKVKFHFEKPFSYAQISVEGSSHLCV